jgi:hypothetical protein
LCQRSKFTGSCNINLNYRSCKRFRRSNVKSFKYGRRSICQNCQVITKFSANFRNLIMIFSGNVSKLSAIDRVLNIKSKPILEETN